MKKYKFIFYLFCYVLVSCNQDSLLKEQDLHKPSAQRTLPAGDPNLNPNWDWTTSNWYVYFNNASGSIGSVSTLNPFLDGSQKIFGNTNPSLADMYPNQGWMLVARDFGTSTDANTFPFLLLYNKYRGLLRVCVLNTSNVLATSQQIKLSFASASSYPNSFKFSSTRADLINGNATNNFSQSAVTFAGPQQWMVAEFNVQGYSSNFDDFSAFNISVSDIVDQSLQLTGNISLDGSAQPQVGGMSFWDGTKILSSFIASTVDPIAKIVKKDINSLVWQNSGTILGSLIDAVSGFTGGGTPSSYNIKLNGTITQNGTLSLISPKTSFSVYLKPINTTAYHAIQSIPWGVYNINPIPYYLVEYADNENPGYTSYYYELRLPANFITSVLSINPAISGQISQIKAKFIDKGFPQQTLNSPFIPLNDFESNYQNYIFPLSNSTFSLQEIGLQIIYNDGTIVYNSIPLHNL
ncbi:hypothetical protein [Flectobacillus longus]|uniref:hypothetical protein n=1 Tax=Flectobacillus longus TaxID=2984207 RepID=UPI0024B6A988|nr:hypothetical protein [Flectobacillus longus]MDI9878525.1 hypothetical protein [Flectobacillus longus]